MFKILTFEVKNDKYILIKIFIDHKSLKYFIIIKELFYCQTR